MYGRANMVMNLWLELERELYFPALASFINSIRNEEGSRV